MSNYRTAEEFSWRHSFWLGVLALFATIIAAVFAAGTYFWTQRQAVAAESQLEQSKLASRPYLLLNPVDVTNPHNPPSGTMPGYYNYKFSYSFSNFGSTPAIIVGHADYVDWRPNLQDFDIEYGVDIQNHIDRSILENGTVAVRAAGKTVNFDATRLLPDNSEFHGPDFIGAQMPDPRSLARKYTIFFGGYVEYTSPTGDQVYKTNFCYQLVSFPLIAIEPVTGKNHCSNRRY